MTITDEFMREMLTKTKPYCVVILKSGPKNNQLEAHRIVWEHGRRNFQLRAEGKLSIVCPVADGSDVSGVGIFNTDLEETKTPIWKKQSRSWKAIRALKPAFSLTKCTHRAAFPVMLCPSECGRLPVGRRSGSQVVSTIGKNTC